MMWFTLTLVGAAILIAFWIWYRQQQRTYLQDLARFVRNAGAATDPWEEPKVIATYGGIHDVEEDGWLT